MTVARRAIVAVACLPFLVGSAQAWTAEEVIKSYPINGTTGAELYASIGERGPKLGPTRAIAATSFKLTWTRRYERQGDACTLVTARPKLLITYQVPKPSAKLAGTMAERWAVFISGVTAHEHVHGEMIRDLVRKIEAATLGLSVPDDPNCIKIKTEMTTRLGALSQEQRRKSREFDGQELSNGGRVHQLILDLVNGDREP